MPIFSISIAGKNYTRNGVCNRCGLCCEIDQCPHLAKEKDKNGDAVCLVYEKRNEVCLQCSSDLISLNKIQRRNHSVCINFPDHPFLECLKEKYGKCGYKFTVDK